jgi:hypothetical protein
MNTGRVAGVVPATLLLNLERQAIIWIGIAVAYKILVEITGIPGLTVVVMLKKVQ